MAHCWVFPIILAALGESARVPLFIIISTHAAVMFVLTTLCAELGQGNAERLADLPKQTVMVLAKNMIVVGLVLGLVVDLRRADPAGDHRQHGRVSRERGPTLRRVLDGRVDQPIPDQRGHPEDHARRLPEKSHPSAFGLAGLYATV
ncbi:MAG: hypothetical protein U5O39_04735 [Gammaproteobacteria bacterium]|nr:hypothetical protein [Gammaproteobacteria bacterium]